MATTFTRKTGVTSNVIVRFSSTVAYTWTDTPVSDTVGPSLTLTDGDQIGYIKAFVEQLQVAGETGTYLPTPDVKRVRTVDGVLYEVADDGTATQLPVVSGAGIRSAAAGQIPVANGDGTYSPGSAGTGALTPTAVKTSAYTAAAGELVLVDTTLGPVTITLPSAVNNGRPVGVKLVTQGTGNNVTVACASSDVLNKTGGATTFTLQLINQAVVLDSKAGVWAVRSTDLPLAQTDVRYLQQASMSQVLIAPQRAQRVVADGLVGVPVGSAANAAVLRLTDYTRRLFVIENITAQVVKVAEGTLDSQNIPSTGYADLAAGGKLAVTGVLPVFAYIASGGTFDYVRTYVELTV